MLAAERLRDLTMAFPEPVLGWFSFRADTRLHLSMREQVGRICCASPLHASILKLHTGLTANAGPHKLTFGDAKHSRCCHRRAPFGTGASAGGAASTAGTQRRRWGAALAAVVCHDVAVGRAWRRQHQLSVPLLPEQQPLGGEISVHMRCARMAQVLRILVAHNVPQAAATRASSPFVHFNNDLAEVNAVLQTCAYAHSLSNIPMFQPSWFCFLSRTNASSPDNEVLYHRR